MHIDIWKSKKNEQLDMKNDHSDTCFYRQGFKDNDLSNEDESSNNKPLTKGEIFGKAKEWIIEKLDSNAEISPLELEKLSRAELPINLQLTISSIRAIHYQYKKNNPELVSPSTYLK